MNRFSMFNSRQRASSMPDIDLTPMLNLIMVVLAFFVLVSMTLTGEPDVVDVKLPGDERANRDRDNSLPLKVKIDEYGGLTADDLAIDRDKLLRQIPAYLANNPESAVYLIPHPDLPYEDVIRLLSQMRDVGGNRVALAIGTDGNSRSDTVSEDVPEAAIE
ncbi:Biopolymer transport protein ExbD/TolR [Geitlerinema sp. FC II]|nr:Biopolymer transport protein ExbD/TolR [Geitlerinema sp. FC II]